MLMYDCQPYPLTNTVKEKEMRAVSIKDIVKEIENIGNERKALKSNIAEMQNKLDDLTSQIQNYDGADANTFKALTDERAFCEHTLEILRRKLSNVINIDEAKLAEDEAAFTAKRDEVVDAANKEILPLVSKLKKVINKADSDLDELVKVFDSWCNAYQLYGKQRINRLTLYEDRSGTLGTIRSFSSHFNRIITKETDK